MHKGYNKGQMTIVSVIALSTILLVVTLSQLFLGFSEYSQSTYDNNSNQARNLAESGIENAIYEYQTNKLTYTNQTFVTPTGNAVVSLSANTSVTPNVITITSAGKFQNITRSISATFTISTPPAISQNAAFSQNNLYTEGATLNGEIFSNNDFSINDTTINGDLYGAGKGNGQKGCINNSTINTYGGSGSNLYVWDPTYLENSSVINGNVYYHTSIQDKPCSGGGSDNTSVVKGSEIKSSNSFLPPIANPSFDFASAKTLATQNGTYFSDYKTFFNSYLPSLCSAPGGCTTTSNTITYNMQPGVYFIDCTGFSGLECVVPASFNWQDSTGRYQSLSGAGISLVFNNTFFDLGGINITSPYSPSAGKYYPAIVANGDLDLLSGTTSVVSVNITGLIYAFGTVNIWGVSASNKSTVDGGIWASNQLNLWNNSVVTYNNNYVQNIYGFNLTNPITHATSWYEY